MLFRGQGTIGKIPNQLHGARATTLTVRIQKRLDEPPIQFQILIISETYCLAEEIVAFL